MARGKDEHVSHTALNIQKEVAFESGKLKGRSELHLRISTYLEDCKARGETRVGIEHLENLLTVWVSGN